MLLVWISGTTESPHTHLVTRAAVCRSSACEVPLLQHGGKPLNHRAVWQSPATGLPQLCKWGHLV